ncbi:MAG: DUF202 domain-containing protein [Pseudomonadota bacterium]
MAKDYSTEMAEERTDWAEDRTVLANERTYAGWMRTGMASLGMAVALKAVFGATEPTWLAKTVATIFVVIALMIFWAAQRNAKKVVKRLDSHAAEPVSSTHFRLIAALLAAGAVATGFVLWML